MSKRFRWIVLGFFAVTLTQAKAQQDQPVQQGVEPHAAEEQAAQRQALGFLGYLDQGRFGESYAYTGMLLRAQADEKGFADKVAKAREGVGALQGRDLIDANYTNLVPGAPAGEYIVVHYHASFANRPDVVETLTLDFANGYWRVDGYYIK